MDYSSLILKIKPRVGRVSCIIDIDQKKYSIGSGFVYGEKGILVTCNHVVKNGSSIVIRFPGVKSPVTAKIVLSDEEHDLALLKFDDNLLEPITLIDKEQISEGMEVVFIGYPFGFGDAITHQGILAAITKDAAGMTTYVIDGSVNSGNSGGPLLNNRGEVMGVINAGRRESTKLLEKVEDMETGAISLHGVDLVAIHHALIENLQLGIGYAVPASYIPDHKTTEEEK